jgi:regulator of protease activity HflC (stomatin/prohibitin superfamily)
MFLIVLGILIAIVAFVVPNPIDRNQRKIKDAAKYVGIGLALVGLLVSSIRVVQPGELGVQVLFGKVQGKTLNSGIHIVNPLVVIETFDVRTQSYTMSGTAEEGDKMADDAMRVLTADGLEVAIDMTILFSVIPSEAPKILSTIGTSYLDKIVRPISRTAIRDNAVNYEAINLYSKKRDEFQIKINQNISKSFEKRGLKLEQILVRNIALPASVKAAIEAKINAEQESQKMEFVLQKEKQEADRKRIEAQGISDYQKILTSTLTDKLLQYESIKAQKEIATSPNGKVIIMGGKGNPVIIDSK